MVISQSRFPQNDLRLASHIAPLLVDLAGCLDSVQVIYPRVNADLVQDSDAGLPGCPVKLPHRGGDIARCHDMRLSLDGCPDDDSVVDEWHQGDDDIVAPDVSIEIRRFDI